MNKSLTKSLHTGNRRTRERVTLLWYSAQRTPKEQIAIGLEAASYNRVFGILMLRREMCKTASQKGSQGSAEQKSSYFAADTRGYTLHLVLSMQIKEVKIAGGWRSAGQPRVSVESESRGALSVVGSRSSAPLGRVQAQAALVSPYYWPHWGHASSAEQRFCLAWSGWHRQAETSLGAPVPSSTL